MKISRRQFLKLTAASGAGLAVPWTVRLGSAASVGALRAFAAPALSDPALQPKFAVQAPNALDPGFKYDASRGGRFYDVGVGYNPNHVTGLSGGVVTPIFGYGPRGGTYTWPGMTFEVQSGQPITVRWQNNLGKFHLLPVDTSLHWAYSLHGYDQYTIADDGVPIVVHVHGGHTDSLYDGNPEYFFSPGNKIKGPQYAGPQYVYRNDQPAGTVWYHDHALGITRLNVYAGMAGFYIIRDGDDTGRLGNPLDLPAFPYEAAFAIQDRMFEATGELFYPAYPGDPFWDEFIPPGYTGPVPSALAEFFGDHMVVNGKIWPVATTGDVPGVEPRNYRLRLLNGCDSRFLAIQFFEVPPNATDFSTVISGPLDFTVIGSDQGLASSPTTKDTLLMETGSRYDIIFDFKTVTFGNRVIMKNIGGSEPFGGDIPGPIPEGFEMTDRIMAFDVVKPLDTDVPDVSPNTGYDTPIVPNGIDRYRKVALFEGEDEYGRLQPLLGTAEPATDHVGMPINWPDEPIYRDNGLTGQMEGTMAWHSPTTENPAMGSTEEWEIWNVTGDAHPVHLHLVHFEILGRQEINWDSEADDDGFVPIGGNGPADDGVYLVPQPVVQHNGELGQGFRIVHPSDPDDGYGPVVSQPSQYVENAPKDMVTALPGQITRIKATFDKPGRYVWHCHILSHEDHEMMRVLHVGGGA